LIGPDVQRGQRQALSCVQLYARTKPRFAGAASETCRISVAAEPRRRTSASHLSRIETIPLALCLSDHS
jgi:hypothetical protein